MNGRAASAGGTCPPAHLDTAGLRGPRHWPAWLVVGLFRLLAHPDVFGFFHDCWDADTEVVARDIAQAARAAGGIGIGTCGVGDFRRIRQGPGRSRACG